MNLNWVDEEFSDLDLGDKRLNKRFLEMTKTFSLSPDECINKSMSKFADKKGSYRLFSNSKFNTEAIFTEHQKGTSRRIKEHETVLLIHDTSFFSFNSKRSIKGLGNIGGAAGSEETHGFIGHYTLAVGTNDVPLGLAAYSSWSRAYECPWEKESGRWLESIEESEKFCSGNIELVHVADREADQFEIFHSCLKEERNFVIRSKHDRILDNGDYYLRWHLDRKQANHEFKIYHPRLKKELEATLKYGELEFFDPGLRQSAGHLKSERRKVKLNIVEVKLKKKLDEKNNLHWILLTNLPVRNYGEAQRIINHYKKRWHIENFFKVLKDGGCKVERASLRTFERLEKYVCLFSIIAWRLYNIKHMAELLPDENASIAFTEDEILVLKIKNKLPLEKDLPIRDAIRLVAKLGGFNGRKGDGEPGMVSLWRGWIKFDGQVEMFQYLRKINFQF